MPKLSSTPKSRICEYCAKEFRKRPQLEEHRRVHTGERPFSCNLCDYSAKRKSHLTLHIRTHLGEKPFKCPEQECSFSACVEGNVTTHHKLVHLGERRFGCGISGCGHKFGTKANLNLHMTTHEENPDRPFQCHLCPYKSKSNNLSIHIRSHLGEKPFKCPEIGCDYSSAVNGMVLQHRRIVHLKEKPFQCSVCSNKFGQKSHLTQHMTTHEENPAKLFKCQLCPHKTKTKNEINIHVFHVHSNTRHFKCPQTEDGCTYAAKTKAHLKIHLKGHGEKNLACPHPDCEYKTNQKMLLKTHLKIHNPDSEKKYKCGICDYSSHLSQPLEIHMRVHTKETPFKCTVGGCSYQAKCPSHVAQHVRSVHEKIRRHKCQVSAHPANSNPNSDSN